MKKNNIEDLFKESFEDFEAEVSPGVWSNIQTALKGVGIGLLGKTLLNKIGTNTIVAIISSAAAIISTVVLINWGKTETKTTANKDVQKKVVEIPKPAKVDEIKDFLATKPAEKNTVEPQPEATTEKVNEKSVEKVKENSSGTIAIKKEKIKEVINEYSSLPAASISASPIGGTVPLIINLSNNGSGTINKWDFGDGQKEVGANPVHVYDVPGVYTIHLTSTSAEGKAVIDSVKIEVTGNSSISSVPKSFSPNGDGVNDVLPFKSKYIASISAVIVDKKGHTVYSWDGVDFQWDGKDLKGLPVAVGTYIYIINAIGVDGKKFEQKGSIILTR
jgi:gliding motility-associated-like protein